MFIDHHDYYMLIMASCVSGKKSKKHKSKDKESQYKSKDKESQYKSKDKESQYKSKDKESQYVWVAKSVDTSTNPVQKH